jgi:hypothetical protein
MTGYFIAAQFITIGLFSESWRDEMDSHSFSDGFSDAPWWDNDDAFYNFVLHPWVGAQYYLAARNRGYHPGCCLLYSALLSTFYEYVPENIILQPSAQDLIVTPLLGSLVGEVFFRAKHEILARGACGRFDQLWLVLMDPLDMAIRCTHQGDMCFGVSWNQEF